MKHYKYIHFFLHNDLKFNPRVVKMINTAEYGFSVDDHLFVTPYKNVYDAVSCYPNIHLYNTKDPHSAEIINYYAPYGDWLILHSVPDWIKAFRIQKKFQKKIIWRTWGHDASLLNVSNISLLKWVKRKIFNFLKISEVRRFFAVGVSSNYIDDLDIKRNYGNVRTVSIPYVEKTKEIPFFDSSANKTFNIMVGHSGRSEDNHIEILNQLKRFENENIRIYLILSYGDSMYIKKIMDYISSKWPQKVEVITRFMPLEEFQRFCSQMDVGIFDGLNSYAIGNISILFGLRKKIFLNRNGLWHKVFVEKDAPHACTDELKTISFKQFMSPLVYKKEKYDGVDRYSFDEYLNMWKDLLKKLDGVKNIM